MQGVSLAKCCVHTSKCITSVRLKELIEETERIAYWCLRGWKDLFLMFLHLDDGHVIRKGSQSDVKTQNFCVETPSACGENFMGLEL